MQEKLSLLDLVSVSDSDSVSDSEFDSKPEEEWKKMEEGWKRIKTNLTLVQLHQLGSLLKIFHPTLVQKPHMVNILVQKPLSMVSTSRLKEPLRMVLKQSVFMSTKSLVTRYF